jgi:hypothetical protein
MPDSSYFDGARAVEALRVVSVSIRHIILGVESRKERAGSDYKVWRAPGNAKFARNSGMRRREIAREASMERSKDAPHQPEATSKTRTFCGELETLETICIAQCT